MHQAEPARPVFSSFRDPDGHLFHQGSVLYRRINPSYTESYRLLQESGLLSLLHREKTLIFHHEVPETELRVEGAYRVIRPEPVPIVTYPYEWCFEELKDAALLTLHIQRTALKHGMSLKDASAYNVQFCEGKPVFIDTLSFEPYGVGKPWIAYRQFCQHFLAPLALMSFVDCRSNLLLKHFIDGIPLDLAARMLPVRSKFNLPVLLHLFAHAGAQEKDREVSAGASMSLQALLGILDHLEGGIKSLKPSRSKKIWLDYYDDTHRYSGENLEIKKALVSRFLTEADPKTILDLGANTGMFSRLASRAGIFTVSADFDHDCIQKNYLDARKEKDAKLLPLVFDLLNPSPGIGWDNGERTPLEERFRPEAVMALALIHHLALSGNLPLRYLAEYFWKFRSQWLIVEFVPKSDSQAQRLLKNRKDIFGDYGQETFEEVFGGFFKVVRKEPVGSSGRWLYLMKREV